MRHLSIFIVLSIWTLSTYSQTSTLDDRTQVLTGVWHFEKVLDKDGNQVEHTVKATPGAPFGNTAKIKATGPEMNLNADRTYVLKFNAQNSDSGIWNLVAADSLELKLVTLKGSSDFNMLKSAADMFGKKLTYDKVGNIVERNIRVITDLNTNELRIQYETDYEMVYSKRK